MIRYSQPDFTPVRRSAEHGFTLVEVMVALLIFAMIASAGVAILAFSVRAQAVTGDKLDDAAAMGRTISILSADLAQAINRPSRDESGTLRPAFLGEGTTVALVRLGWSNVDAAPRPSAQKVTYRVASGALERIGYPMLDGAQPFPPATLLTRVRRAQLRYRFRGAWSDRWDGAGGAPLPDAAELSIVREDGTTWRQMFLVGTGYAPPAATGG
ncbi:type II secretion system minor pseudopilin GspJ [Sphingomonas sp.]|uniref:type II secretion system minor pseudopilin GspJ n=1 Tax=Sphingomonas sp. TaxID=28214 RepID=UPI002ED85EEC